MGRVTTAGSNGLNSISQSRTSSPMMPTSPI